jgi:hypothetical protein
VLLAEPVLQGMLVQEMLVIQEVLAALVAGAAVALREIKLGSTVWVLSTMGAARGSIARTSSTVVVRTMATQVATDTQLGTQLVEEVEGAVATGSFFASSGRVSTPPTGLALTPTAAMAAQVVVRLPATLVAVEMQVLPIQGVREVQETQEQQQIQVHLLA